MAQISIPTVEHDGSLWGKLSFFARKHQICAERIQKKRENYSFVGGHRIRVYSVEGNVHWRIPPAGKEVDIADLKSRELPRRRSQGRRKE